MYMNIKYDKATLANAVNKNVSVAGVLRHLGLRQSGGNHTHISSRIKHFKLDTSHFCGKTKAKGRSVIRKTSDKILILRKSGRREQAIYLRRALIDVGREFKCECCGVGDSWNGLPLTLEVDHKNRNWLDDRKENLRFLCPNCHSQQ